MKKVIGMIHLNDNNVYQALKEIEIFQRQELTGALVEDYFGNFISVVQTLHESRNNFDIDIGVNILKNRFGKDHYELATALTKEYDLKFIQVDAVAGNYRNHNANNFTRKDTSFLYGGVWPKYYTPIEGSNFQEDLLSGKEKANAIVITGQATGMPTPIDKLIKAREIIGDHEIIVGAGVTLENVAEQLAIADGCIIGSSLKTNGNDYMNIEEDRVKRFMEKIKEI